MLWPTSEKKNPLLMADWDECLKRIAKSAP